MAILLCIALLLAELAFVQPSPVVETTVSGLLGKRSAGPFTITPVGSNTRFDNSQLQDSSIGVIIFNVTYGGADLSGVSALHLSNLPDQLNCFELYRILTTAVL
jgi:hypothetical protein